MGQSILPSTQYQSSIRCCYERGCDPRVCWIGTQPELLAALPELKDKVLGCYCKPEDCHGDILAELVIVFDETLGERDD